MSHHTDRLIINTVERFFRAIDRLDWDTVGSLMTNPVHVDYSKLGAGPATDTSPRAIVQFWKGFLPGFDGMHHHLGPLNIEVEDDSASVRTHIYNALHIAGGAGGDIWQIYGLYAIDLKHAREIWKISSLTLDVSFMTGSLDLPVTAAARVTARVAKAAARTTTARKR